MISRQSPRPAPENTDESVAPLALLRPIRTWIALAAVLQVFSAGLVLAPLVGMSELVRILSHPIIDQAHHTWHIIALSCGCLAAGVALRGLADLTTHLADNAFSLWIRRQLAQRMSNAPLAWFTATSSGRIKQGMQDDVTAIHHLVAHAWLNVANAGATMLFVFGYLLWVDWHMTLVTLAPLLVSLMLYARVISSSRQRMPEYGAALAQVNQSVVEFVQGIAIVKTFGQDGRAYQAYRQAVDAFQDFFLGWAQPLIKPECLSAVAIAPITLLLLVLGSGIGLMALDMLTVWQLLPFAIVALGISVPVAALSHSAQSLQMAQGALIRLRDLLAIPQQSAPVSALRPSGNRVAFEDVSFAYQSTGPLLQDISLTLQPGTVTAIVGESGAGKTTLAKLLLRFVEADRGCITLGGIDVRHIDGEHLYRQVGAVFQDTQLLRISIYDNIAIGNPQASEAQVIAAARAAQIHERILRLPFGYQSIYSEDACFSGGEAQRIAIARALLLRPAVLILDEPTAQADAESEAAIQSAFGALLAQQQDQVVLVIAHRLNTIMHADNIVVLSHGRITEQGRHSALLAANGEYARMWAMQHVAEQEALCC